jgi:hypothetical protein
MQMHNKDIIFAANAQSVEVTKFASFFSAITSVPTNVTTLGVGIQTWRIDSGIP